MMPYANYDYARLTDMVMKRYLSASFLYVTYMHHVQLIRLVDMDEDAFKNGLNALEAKDYNGALRDFELVSNSIDKHHDQYNRIESFLGLARVLTNNDSGLLMCRDAAGHEKIYGDVFLNAACAEWHSNQRKRAIDTVYKGLEIDPKHQKLKQVLMMLDSRKRNVVRFLDRNHIINRLLGRLFRRKSPELTVHTLIILSRV